MRPKFYLTQHRRATAQAAAVAFYEAQKPPPTAYWGVNARMCCGAISGHIRRYAETHIREHGRLPTGIHVVLTPNVSPGTRTHDFEGGPKRPERPKFYLTRKRRAEVHAAIVDLAPGSRRDAIRLYAEDYICKLGRMPVCHHTIPGQGPVPHDFGLPSSTGTVNLTRR